MPTPQSPRGIAPNPYSRQPVKQRRGLADRRIETDRIEYYLGLTLAGHSPHIALIGERGVGKTSLLNAAQTIADEKGLLTVRIDLNEDKASSPGRFWYDFYSTLLLAAGRAGCWGGSHGEIYRALFAMIHMGQPAPIDMTVLQFPQIFAHHLSNLDAVNCVDALIVQDLQTVLDEATKGLNLRGLAILIDEADCIGTNVSLLQMFRNIFQRIDSVALVLAGTDAIFPRISEVFSPIPRQFHRISVEAFGSWADTWNLVCAPLDDETMYPNVETAVELHDLCGGDPAELQLYCHHMYTEIESGSTDKMSLQPRVFRRVMREYQETAPPSNDEVFAAIEGLPDSLLFESRWLRRERISCEQNVEIEWLEAELRAGEALGGSEAAEVAARVRDSYRALHAAGAITSADRFQLVGGAVAAGYWKSYVEVERSKRWFWNKSGYTDLVTHSVVRALANGTDAVVIRTPALADHVDAIAALRCLRAGGRVSKLAAVDVYPIVRVAIAGADSGISATAVDLKLVVGVGGASTVLRLSYLTAVDGSQVRTTVESWVESHLEVLERRKASVEVGEVEDWTVPSSEELQWLVHISEAPALPEKYFGPSVGMRALHKFDEGDVAAAADLFRQMIWYREDAFLRNNYAYCLLVLGEYNEAGSVLEQIPSKDANYMVRHNIAVQEILSGSVQSGVTRLELLWKEVQEERVREKLDAYSMLTLGAGLDTVTSRAELPVDAAVVLNLVTLGRLGRADAVLALEEQYPEKCAPWLGWAKKAGLQDGTGPRGGDTAE